MIAGIVLEATWRASTTSFIFGLNWASVHRFVVFFSSNVTVIWTPSLGPLIIRRGLELVLGATANNDFQGLFTWVEEVLLGLLGTQESMTTGFLSF